MTFVLRVALYSFIMFMLPRDFYYQATGCMALIALGIFDRAEGFNEAVQMYKDSNEILGDKHVN